MKESGRPVLDDIVHGIAQEDAAASLPNPHRGGEVILLRHLRLRPGDADTLTADDFAFLRDKVGAIVRVDAVGAATVGYFTSYDTLDEAWAREEEQLERDAEAAREAAKDGPPAA
jgi:hypothetical protein